MHCYRAGPCVAVHRSDGFGVYTTEYTASLAGFLTVLDWEPVIHFEAIRELQDSAFVAADPLVACITKHYANMTQVHARARGAAPSQA